MTTMTIHCECGESYRLRSTDAGRRFRCRACDAVITARPSIGPTADQTPIPPPELSAVENQTERDDEEEDEAGWEQSGWGQPLRFSSQLPPRQTSSSGRADGFVLAPDAIPTNGDSSEDQERPRKLRRRDRHPVLTIALAVMMGWHGIVALYEGRDLIVLANRRNLMQAMA
ncbi:MAG: hypothetical protein KDA96_23470, partial [Planctomycetaceae bacterium]|nr:hypothetical protein [Planctomycetaceae bacterium]